jgi:thiamine-phosphate pyrophosphorylase
MSTTPVFRMLDASLNRAGEGLRVVEDYVRMVLDSPQLTGLAKSLRHDLAGVAGQLDSLDLHASRDTQHDVGTTTTTAAELTRADLADVAVASFKRVEQSLRSLEEYGKLVDVAWAQQIEQLRYRAYTLEKAIGTAIDSRARLAYTRLMVLVDGSASADAFAELVGQFVAAGVGAIQLREKNLDDRELLARARQLCDSTHGTSTLAMINDRPDIAALAQADGVHLGQDDMTVKDARTIVGPRTLIGVSTHHIEQARRAVLDGANYLGAGPTFPSRTKSFDAFAGLAYLRELAAENGLPVFAIGGIDADNLPQVIEAGVTRVAVGAAVTGIGEPGVAVRKLSGMLTEPDR